MGEERVGGDGQEEGKKELRVESQNSCFLLVGGCEKMLGDRVQAGDGGERLG